MSLLERITESSRSFMRLPLWVRLWLLLVLIPANAASFSMKDTPTGLWASRAAAFIGAVNGSIILAQRGWGKALAVPHLIVWIPLLFLAWRRVGESDVPRRERIYAAILLVINGTSVAFDVADTVKWLRGDRSVP